VLTSNSYSNQQSTPQILNLLDTFSESTETQSSIEFKINKNLKKKVGYLRNRIDFLKKRRFSNGTKGRFDLTLDLEKEKISFSEWEEEYNLVCEMCDEEPLSDSAVEQKRQTLLNQLSAEDKLTLEEYKVALGETGNRLELDKELKVNRLKLRNRIFELACQNPDKTNKKSTKPIAEAIASIYEQEVFKGRVNGGGGLTADELDEFITLNKMSKGVYFKSKMTNEEMETIEAYKLAIMQKMQRYLEKKYPSAITVNTPDLSQNALQTPQDQLQIQRQLKQIEMKRQVLDLEVALSGISLQDQRENLKKDKEKSLNTDKEKLQEQLNQQQSQPKMSWYAWPLFIGLMLIDFAPMVISGILYAKSALDFLPFTLPVLAATAVGVCLNVIELLVTYSFVAPILKQRLGIPEASQKSVPALYQQQLDTTNKVNGILSNVNEVNKMSWMEYRMYAVIASQFNQSLVDARNGYSEFMENIGSKILRSVMTVINLAHNAAGVVFMVKQFLLAMAPTMTILSSLGLAVVGVMLAGQLASRYIYRANSLFVLMNPTAQQHDTVELKLNNFKRREDREFQEVLDDKKSRLKQPVVVSEPAAETGCRKEGVPALPSSTPGSFYKPQVPINVTSVKAKILEGQPLNEGKGRQYCV